MRLGRKIKLFKLTTTTLNIAQKFRFFLFCHFVDVFGLAKVMTCAKYFSLEFAETLGQTEVLSYGMLIAHEVEIVVGQCRFTKIVFASIF